MHKLLATLLVVCLSDGSARGDSLRLPASVMERHGTTNATYRLDPPGYGAGVLELRWTDNVGRLVERHRLNVDLAKGADISVPLDLSRAVTMVNDVRADLVLGERRGSAATQFLARPPAGWDDLQIMIYQDKTPAKLAGMAALGVTGGKVLGFRVPFTQADVDGRVAPFLAADLRWYVENIATDFYSAYHRWTPEHPQDVNWNFLETQAKHLRDPSDPSVNIREPSLSDPTWLAHIRERLSDTVKAHMAYRPLWYTLGDEPGIADLAAAWDFDFSPGSLVALRAWLRLHYGTLAALNNQWGASFTQWDGVRPPTTTDAMQRSDDNFSAWNDFKAFMDEVFASALRAGTEAVHQADPAAISAIEGGQIPGWGGYDYAQLAGAVDAMELYEGGSNVEIVRSLNPTVALLSTTFDTGPEGQRQIWHSLLSGVRGLVVWDENDDIMGADGQPGQRGRSEAALYATLRGGLGAQIIATAPHLDKIGVLYSPTSFRIQWLLDQRASGDAWTRRGSEAEGQDNATRQAMRQTVDELHEIGLQPRFLSSGLLERGALRDGTINALVLPRSIALSDTAAAEIRNFANSGGMVITEGNPGTFDGHGRRLATPQLSGMKLQDLPQTAGLRLLLESQGIVPEFVLTRPDGSAVHGVETHVLKSGAVSLLSLQRNSAARSDSEIVLTLPQLLYVHEIGSDKWSQPMDSIALQLDPVAPTLLVLAPRTLPGLTLEAPVALRAGENGRLHLALAGPSPAGPHVLHIEVSDPSGQVVRTYSGNTVLRGQSLDWPLAIALNDVPGNWTIRARDVLSGRMVQAIISITRP